MTYLAKIVREIKLNVWECSECRIPVCLTVDHEAQLRTHGGTFYCPAGHAQSWHGSTENDRLRKSLHAETLARESAERRAREALAARDKAEMEARRMKTRAKAGVCPCCNRTFKQLAAHMKNKHPELAK